MIKEIVSPAKPKMENAVEHFIEELKSLRTGRANSAMLEGVLVPYYGSMSPLKALATITTPDSSTITITPFDAGTINDIRLGIESSDMGFRASDDGRVLRISVPPLTAERREELVKSAHKMAEQARIIVRLVRGEFWDKVQAREKAGEISEDNRDWGRAELDKMTAELNKKIEDILKEKEVEIRKV